MEPEDTLSLRDAAILLNHDGDAAARLEQYTAEGSSLAPYFGAGALIDSVASGAIAPLRGRWILQERRDGPCWAGRPLPSRRREL